MSGRSYRVANLPRQNLLLKTPHNSPLEEVGHAYCIYIPLIRDEVGVNKDVRAASNLCRGLDLHLVQIHLQALLRTLVLKGQLWVQLGRVCV